MRRMSWFVVASIAAGSLVAQTPPAPAERADADAQPQLIHSVAVNAEDSPLVKAAKNALAARQNAKNRIKIDERTMRAAGHVSQGTGPTTLSMNFPDSSGSPAPTSPAAAAERARQRELDTKIQALRQEQERMAAEAEQPYGGDTVDEDRVTQRQTQIPQEIDQLHQQQAPPPPPPNF